jgi:hypothetical protein
LTHGGKNGPVRGYGKCPIGKPAFYCGPLKPGESISLSVVGLFLVSVCVHSPIPASVGTPGSLWALDDDGAYATS